MAWQCTTRYWRERKNIAYLEVIPLKKFFHTCKAYHVVQQQCCSLFADWLPGLRGKSPLDLYPLLYHLPFHSFWQWHTSLSYLECPQSSWAYVLLPGYAGRYRLWDYTNYNAHSHGRPVAGQEGNCPGSLFYPILLHSHTGHCRIGCLACYGVWSFYCNPHSFEVQIHSYRLPSDEDRTWDTAEGFCVHYTPNSATLLVPILPFPCSFPCLLPPPRCHETRLCWYYI